ncbi:hypothetical protein J6590_031224 [Homalodisca vitripennis]|nr:hypothetical protein J6590_031224 [Homalodisca vitripennis]
MHLEPNSYSRLCWYIEQSEFFRLPLMELNPRGHLPDIFIPPAEARATFHAGCLFD